MSRQSYHGRRRGVYISPVMVLTLVAVLAVAGWIFLGGDSAEEPDIPAAEQTPDPAPEQTPDEMSVNGIPCTLRDLGEEAIYTGELILVNNQTMYRFPERQKLRNVLAEKGDSYYVKDGTVDVDPATMTALNDLMDAFRDQGGSKTVNIVAGYRTAEFQQGLYDRSVERNGKEHADRYVAQPGGSEHHTGYAVDLHILHADGSSQEYDGTGEYAWINENCQDYGFVVRYDQAKADKTGIYDEPWHFRYVGTPHATKMVEEGLCMEEYIDYLKKFTFENRLSISCVSGNYEVWYTEGTEVYLPDSGDYQVSGNNVDGVIVTLEVK